MSRATTTGISSASNTSLHAAKQAKNDEFYTQLGDIEDELRHYKDYFKGKVVFCNCDDPDYSSFWKYFTLKFKSLGLAKLVATHYASEGSSYKLEYFSTGKTVKTALIGDGDFRSPECVEILKKADIVVTNPPFSLFREYVAQLVDHDKQFLIIGNKNAITYKEIFKLIRENKLWAGVRAFSGGMWFVADYIGKYEKVVDGVKLINVPAIWLTNMDNKKRHEGPILYRTYAGNESNYPKYDNYDAIEVSRVVDIPADYLGCIGVPITFLDKYNPTQFEILGITDRGNNSGLKTREYGKSDAKNAGDLNRRGVLKIGGRYVPTYARLLITRKTA